MKKRLPLLMLVTTIIGFVSFAQTFQTQGEWTKFPKEYKDYSISIVDKWGDNYVAILTYEYGGKKLAVVDENLQILRSMDFNDRKNHQLALGGDGWRRNGMSVMTIKNDCLEYLYADCDDKTSSRVLTRHSYDLKTMTHVKNEELLRSNNLDPNNEVKSSFRRKFYDFNEFAIQWSENEKYVGIVTYAWYHYQRCFNLILYDSQFNKMAEIKGLDSFQLPELKSKELVEQYQDYDFDFNVSNDGRMTFVRSVSKRFLLSDGSDVAILELSKEGVKRHDFGKVLGKCHFYSPDLLQVKDGKAEVIGIYAPVAEKKDSQLEGYCTLEFDMNTDDVQQVEKMAFEAPVSVSWSIGFLPITVGFLRRTITQTKGEWKFENLILDKGAGQSYHARIYIFKDVWQTSKGWILTSNGKVFFLDTNGRTKATYPLNKNVDSYARFVYNDKLYYAVWLKDYFISIDENGNEVQHPIPNYRHLYRDDHYLFISHDKPDTWSFFKIQTGAFMSGKIQFGEL